MLEFNEMNVYMVLAEDIYKSNNNVAIKLIESKGILLFACP